MVELKSFPFDSIADDREYPAQIFRNYFHKFLSTGVYFGKYKNYGDYSMKVVTSLGLNVRVTKGAGVIKGLDFELEEDKVLPIELSLGKIRKDMVVVKADDTLAERKTTLYIKQGTDADFAELERTADIYELCIAKITVGDTKLEIELDDIEDTRRDSELAGIVTSLIDIDIQDVLDDINKKKDSYFAKLGIETKEEINIFINELQTYCDTAKEVLDENVAMNLLNLIITKADIPRRKDLTLLSSNWFLDETETKYKYKYTIQDEAITKEHRIFCTIYEDDEDKMIDGLMETFNGYYIVKTSKKPTEDIRVELVIIKTTDKNAQVETTKELEYEIKTKTYDENAKFHLEQDGNLETIINVTDNILDENNIIIEET